MAQPVARRSRALIVPARGELGFSALGYFRGERYIHHVVPFCRPLARPGFAFSDTKAGALHQGARFTFQTSGSAAFRPRNAFRTRLSQGFFRTSSSPPSASIGRPTVAAWR
jgi:hypothetical protein